MTRVPPTLRILIILLPPLALGACSGRELMPTPNLYAGPSSPDPFAGIPPELRGTEVDILYATDRKPLEKEEAEGRVEYGTERSPSLAFGSCRVRIGGEELTWEELVADSRTRDRCHDLPLSITAVEELGRFPATPHDIVETAEGKFVTSPEELRREAEAIELLQGEIRGRLARTPRKDVCIFVHGIANSFEDSVLTVAEFYHFLSRAGVPVAYTWPARGSYMYDRESGEFTGFHLKAFLRSVAAMKEVEGIHLVAHSRGTDIASTTLRELFIESRGAGEDALKKYKIRNLILLAPDLDLGVVLQRLTSENFGPVIGRVTVYSSSGDRAIGLASWLFGGSQRLGKLRPEDLTPAFRKRLAFTSRTAFIDAEVSTGFLGHSYYRNSPAVSSDLVLILGEDRDPGAEHGRPLIPVDVGFWEINDDYLLPEE